MDIIHKSWKITTPPLKKLLSHTITHSLSRHLDRTKFEVVFEGFLDSENSSSEQPDVVIYSKKQDFKPIIAIEVCTTEEIVEMVFLAKHLAETYQLREFFIFNYKTDQWLLIDRHGLQNSSSYSSFLSVDLKKMIDLFPFDKLKTGNH